jgi:probable selenium-dependent hydroxylase accessory protein YqeC
MTRPLASQIGLGPHELVSIVGAGGKTTLLHELGRDLTRDHHRVLLTTTTRMASNQVTEPVCWSVLPRDIAGALVPDTPLFVMSRMASDKAVGLEPAMVDSLFEEAVADYILVEADGARTMSIKAPADHEPAIPEASTTVIVVMGADAIGCPLSQVAHRPERVAEITSTTIDAAVTAEIAATTLLHRSGGLKSIPPNARIVMVITKVSHDTEAEARELAMMLEDNSRVDLVIIRPVVNRQFVTDG